MGQSHSTANDDADSTQDVPLKQDYYELLGVERSATDEEIKKAYRRKALELHPDRNYGNVEETTKLFAEVQSAYEVLSDSQERAWYDSHRDVLLRGDAVGAQNGEEYSYNTKMTTTDEVLKLMLKFNGRLDFSNAPSGFYGGLNDFFQQLAKEEEIACQWEEEDLLEYPEFGTKEDEYEDIVRPFYAAWTGFATRKSYAWKDQYRLSDAPDRRIRRLMEKENRKIRDDAVQEFNDAVRSLVAFVRKRDPRVRNNQKSEAERQKALKDLAAAQAARAKAARQAQNEELENYVVPEWAQSRTKDELEGEFSSESDDEEHLYDCVVCDKTFKSEAQFKAHEKSKKHIKLLKQLQKEMRKEGKELDLSAKGGQNHADSAETSENENDEHTESRDQLITHAASNDSWSASESGVEAKQPPHVNPKSVQNTTSNSLAGVSAESRELQEIDSDDENGDSDDDDSDYAPRAAIEERLTGPTSPDIDPNLSKTLEEIHLSSGIDNEDAPQTFDYEAQVPYRAQPETVSAKVGKAKQKRAKKAAAQAGASVQSAVGGTNESEFSCVVCGEHFASRTKLFSHIQKENHAAPVAQVRGGKSKPGKGKKR